jgi:predicted DNA-binding protein (MmcQ/YjbR family)
MRASARRGFAQLTMNQESIREFCKKLPHVTESVQWGHDLVFKVGGKMFCVMPTEAAPMMLSFKASAENFHQLQEIDGIVPAPYMARAQWVALRRLNLLPDAELKELLTESHTLVFSSLKKKLQAELSAPANKSKATKKKSPAKRVRA